MPFIETCRMEERIRMLLDYDTGNWSVGYARQHAELGDPQRNPSVC
jgi:hypothetical protein